MFLGTLETTLAMFMSRPDVGTVDCYSTLVCSTLLYSTLLCSALLCSTLLYSTLLYLYLYPAIPLLCSALSMFPVECRRFNAVFDFFFFEVVQKKE